MNPKIFKFNNQLINMYGWDYILDVSPTHRASFPPFPFLLDFWLPQVWSLLLQRGYQCFPILEIWVWGTLRCLSSPHFRSTCINGGWRPISIWTQFRIEMRHGFVRGIIGMSLIDHEYKAMALKSKDCKEIWPIAHEDFSHSSSMLCSNTVKGQYKEWESKIEEQLA